MNKTYLGLDIGTKSIKVVVINKYNNIILKNKIIIKNDITKQLEDLIKDITKQLKIYKYKIISIGVTGKNRNKILKILTPNIIKNEIDSSFISTNILYRKVNTIIDLGKDLKIINIKNNKIKDYEIFNIIALTKEEHLKEMKKNLEYLLKKNNIKNVLLIGELSKNKEILNIITKYQDKSIYLTRLSEYIPSLGVAIICKNKIENTSEQDIIGK